MNPGASPRGTFNVLQRRMPNGGRGSISKRQISFLEVFRDLYAIPNKLDQNNSCLETIISYLGLLNSIKMDYYNCNTLMNRQTTEVILPPRRSAFPGFT